MPLFQKYFSALLFAALLPDAPPIHDQLVRIPGVRVIEIGRTGNDNPMYAAIIGQPRPGEKYHWEQFDLQHSDQAITRAAQLAANKTPTLLIPATNPDGPNQRYSNDPDDITQNRIESRNLAAFRAQFALLDPGPGQYLVPAHQHDLPTTYDLLQRFHSNGARVIRMKSSGDFAILGGAKLLDLHLPELMGIEIRPFTGPTEGNPLTDFRPEGQSTGRGDTVLLDPRENNSYLAMAFLFDRAEPVWWTRDGQLIIDSGFTNSPARARNFSHEIGITTRLVDSSTLQPAWQIYRPRIAVYSPPGNHSDTGWTQWLLDVHKVPFTLIHDSDFSQTQNNLESRFDTIVFPSQQQTPTTNLQHFVEQGGTLIALGAALPSLVQQFHLPLQLTPPAATIERMTADPTNRIAFGMPPSFSAITDNGFALEGGTSIAKFESGRSGVVEIRQGKGTIILFGIRPQYRGQTFATFKLLLNAIFTGAAREVR